MEKQNEEGQDMEARLAQLRDELAGGLDQARRREFVDARALRERIREKSRNRRRKPAWE